MKKVLLSLLAVAALVLSCQNYDDEFDALNSKIASLESQITSLAELKTAVTGVQSSVSALQTAVAAAQAAAEAAGDAAEAAGDAAEAAGDANAEAAASNAESITALATSVAAIAADLVDLQTAIDGATTEADLDALKEELNTTLAALQTLIETNSASISSLITTNSELKDALQELGVDVDSVLAANATFEGNLTITNAAELAYAKSLGNKVATIKGDVYVKVDQSKHSSGGDGTGLTAADVNSVVSQISYVVGNFKVDTDASLNLSKLGAVTGDYIVINHDVEDDSLLSVGGDMHLDYDGPYKSNVQTVGNIYFVPRASAVYSPSTGVAAQLGTTLVDFTALTKGLGVQSVSSDTAKLHTSGSSLSYGFNNSDNSNDKTIDLNVGAKAARTTKSVKIGKAPVISVSGTSVEEIELHYAADVSSTNPTGSAALASLSITAESLSTAIVKAQAISGNVTIDVKGATATTVAGTVDLSSTKSIGGKLTSDAASTTVTALESVYGITLSEQLAVSFPALTTSGSTVASGSVVKDGDIVFNKATSISLPKLSVVGTAKSTTKAEQRADITAPKVTSVSLPSLTLAGTLTFAEATSFSAPLANLVKVDLNSEATSFEASSMSLPLSSSIVELATIEVLKLNSQKGENVSVNGSSQLSTTTAAVLLHNELDSAVSLTALTFKGYAAANTAADLDLDLSATTFADLASVTIGGAMNKVIIRTTNTGYEAEADLTKLTSITTEGTIRELVIENNFDLTSLTLGHSEDLYASGSSNDSRLGIIRNRKLNTFTTTNLTMVRAIIIKENSSLSSFDLSSINKVPTNIVKTNNDQPVDDGSNSIIVHIMNNHLSPVEFDELSTSASASNASTLAQTLGQWDGILGTYVPASNAQATVYGQSSLKTLSNLISAIDTKFTTSTPVKGDYPFLDFELAYKYQASATTVGDIVISQTAITSLNPSGSSATAGNGNSTNATISAANDLLMLAELKKIQ
jgi:hypothetical protein